MPGKLAADADRSTSRYNAGNSQSVRRAEIGYCRSLAFRFLHSKYRLNPFAVRHLGMIVRFGLAEQRGPSAITTA